MSNNNFNSPEPTRRGPLVCPGAPCRNKRQQINQIVFGHNEPVLVPPVCPVEEGVNQKQTEFEEACYHSYRNRSREEQDKLKKYFRELFP
jgi:hypothetical protein